MQRQTGKRKGKKVAAKTRKTKKAAKSKMLHIDTSDLNNMSCYINNITNNHI
jgi:hypothetical protein